jgi:CRP-like cAMP-binding protein/cytochrome P450
VRPPASPEHLERRPADDPELPRADAPVVSDPALACPLGFGNGAAPRPPTVKGHPLIGNSFQILRRPWDFLQSAYRSHGPAYQVSILGRKAFVLGGPDVRDLYAEAGDDFLDRSFFYDRLQTELGAKELIFRTKGDRHRELRRSASLAFSRHLAAEHVPATATQMVQFFDSLAAGSHHDALGLSSEVLLAAGGPMLAGCDLQPSAPLIGKYAATLMEIAGHTRSLFAAWSPGYRRAKRRSLELARELLKDWRRGALGSEAGNYTIGVLAEARDADGKGLPDEDVVALAALSFVGLGVYISRVVAFMLYELLRDRALRARAIEEVDRVFALGYNHEALSQMRLLRAVYSETLRRYPIWFLVPFRAEQDFQFTSKQILRGDLVLLSSVQEHFLPDFYKEPNRFDADRCLPPRSENSQRGAFAPFGLGGRRCVAAGQTEVMALLATALLLHRTHFELAARGALQVRLKPLPAPHRLQLRFEGKREFSSAPSSPSARSSSVAERLDRVSERLEWDDAAFLHRVVDREMDVLVFGAGTELIRQGDAADAFYVIESGEVQVLRETESGHREALATLGPGEIFGELGLLRRHRRNATCVVAPDTERLVVMRCSAESYERLLGSLNVVGEELIALIRRRKVAASIAALVPALDRQTLNELVGSSRFQRGRAGDVFVREGDAADAFYLIERGSFEVVAKAGTPREHVLARLQDGDFFGEIGILRSAPRNATVRVAPDCQQADVLVVGRDAFLELLEPRSSLRESIFAELGRRVGEPTTDPTTD